MNVPPSHKIKGILRIPGFSAEDLAFLQSKGCIYKETTAYPDGGYYFPEIVNPHGTNPGHLVARYSKDTPEEPFSLCFYENESNAFGIITSKNFDSIKEEFEIRTSAMSMEPIAVEYSRKIHALKKQINSSKVNRKK